jgi:hypothetical protein
MTIFTGEMCNVWRLIIIMAKIWNGVSGNGALAISHINLKKEKAGYHQWRENHQSRRQKENGVSCIWLSFIIKA